MSAGERFLVTGAYGCIGAWTVRQLLDEGAGVVTYDLGGSDHRLRLVLEPDELDALPQVRGDITDLAQLKGTFEEHGITHVIHLAALQVPFVRADPPLGARVNVVGTVNVFEAVRAANGLHGTLAYASSIAAYDPGDDLTLSGTPATLYGVFKRANEETAGVYWADHGIASIGLRPHTVYGPGRDQGVTSALTKAMLAAAAGSTYSIPYGGLVELQYTKDIARAFVTAARASAEGATVHDPPGAQTSVGEVIGTIHAVAPESAETVTFDDIPPMGVPGKGDSRSFVELLGSLEVTPLETGVTRTIEQFRALLAKGLVKAEAAV